jgi:hypothetical protein
VSRRSERGGSHCGVLLCSFVTVAVSQGTELQCFQRLAQCKTLSGAWTVKPFSDCGLTAQDGRKPCTSTLYYSPLISHHFQPPASLATTPFISPPLSSITTVSHPFHTDTQLPHLSTPARLHLLSSTSLLCLSSPCPLSPPLSPSPLNKLHRILQRMDTHEFNAVCMRLPRRP